jgi:hypothetical protein
MSLAAFLRSIQRSREKDCVVIARLSAGSIETPKVETFERFFTGDEECK